MSIREKLSGTGPKAIIAVVVVAVLAAGAYFVFFAGSSNKTVTARFTEAVGIYPGTPVDILGVPVGSVTKVKPTGDYVAITMSYSGRYKLPPKAGAVAVANSLVSDRYIQLTPVYKGGSAMPSGATIPTSRTGAPAEIDDIYAALNKLSLALGPAGANKGGQQSGALNALLKVSAANLKGNGALLGNSLAKLSDAARTLANSRGNLFGTVRNLQKFTTTLKGSDTQIRQFNQLLAQVAGDLASERSDLGGALKQLGLALNDVQEFVHKNASRFHTDIHGLRSILGTVVKQKASVQEALAVAPVALANITHSYDPALGAIATRGNLASFTSTDQVSQLACNLITKIGGSVSSGGVITLPTTIGSTVGSQLSSACKQAAANAGTAGGGASPIGGVTGGGGTPGAPDIGVLSGSSPQSSTSLPGLIGAGS